MEETGFSSLNLVAALVLIILNGFFVAAEFALVRVRESRIVQLEQEGSNRAGVVHGVLRDLDTYLSVCQVGITIASLALGWVGEPAVRPSSPRASKRWGSRTSRSSSSLR